jgi:type IV pilus assembly protein PilN
MIRINLLPVRAAKKKQAGIHQVVLMGVLILLVAVVMVMVVTVHKAERAKLEKEIVRTRDELQKLEQIIGEVNQYSATKAMLESKLKVIEDLKKGRTGPVKVLDEMAQKIPKKVWLVKMEEKDKLLQIAGEAATDEDIAAFMQDLQKSPYFQGLRLKYTKIADRQDQGGMKIKTFEMECQVNYAI